MIFLLPELEVATDAGAGNVVVVVVDAPAMEVLSIGIVSLAIAHQLLVSSSALFYQNG